MGNQSTNLNNLLTQYTSNYSADWAQFGVTIAGEIFRNEITGDVAPLCHLLLQLEELGRVSIIFMETARIGSILVPECLQGCMIGWQ